MTRLYPLLSVLTVVGITIRLYWNLAKATDLPFSDDAGYLTVGRRFLHEGVLPNFQYSPLYAVWYAAHLALSGDTVIVYYAQIYVVVVLTAIVLYWYLRLIEVPRSLSLLGTVLWITQPGYITQGVGTGAPRVYHFALLLFLTGAVVLRKLKADGGLPLALAGTSFLLLAIVVRPEYLASLVFFLCAVAFLARSRWQLAALKPYSRWLWAACLLVGVTTLVAWMYLKSSPLAGGASHSWAAFGDFFCVNRLGSWSRIDDRQQILGEVFPRAHSVLTAAVTNPKAFGFFELHNIIMVPHTIFGCFTKPYGVMKALVVCLTFVWISFITSTGASLRTRALLRSASALGPYVLSAAATVLPVTLLTPRITYLLPLLFVLFVGALKWLSIILEEEPVVRKSLIGLSAVMLSLVFAVIPSPFDISKNAGRPAYLEMTEIRAILEAEKVQGVAILQAGWAGYAAFLPYGVAQTVNHMERRENERFWDFVDRAHIEAVLVDDRLRLNRLYRDDSEFALFLHSPTKFGWTAEPVGVEGDVFYLHDRRQYKLQ